jgi:cysteinyl-tRNA synthetase
LDDKLLLKMKLERAFVDEIVAKRASARDAKNFALADEFRKKLTELNISVSDTPEGSFWEVSK